MTYKVKTGTRIPSELPDTEEETLAAMKAITDKMAEIDSDPKSKIGATGIYIYNKARNAKHENLSWQIYHLEKHLRGLRGEKVTYPFAGHNHG